MNITYDEKARTAMMNMMIENNKTYTRLKVARVGCGKPAIDLYAEDKREGDIVINKGGINFVVDKNENRYLHDVEIKYNKEVYNNDGFYVRVT